jgi:hypothetical protein
MTLDLTRSPEQIVVDRINTDNVTKLDASKLRFGAPRLNNGTKNTRVTVTGLPFSGIIGTVEINYNRIDLNTIPGIGSRVFYADETHTKISDIIPIINSTYGVNLTPADYVNGYLMTPDDLITEVDFVIRAAEKSLVYVGVLELKLRIAPAAGDIELGLVLTSRYLHGFTYEFLST